MRGSDTAVIYLDDVRVPAKNIIGEPGMGFTYQMLQFQEERLKCGRLVREVADSCLQFWGGMGFTNEVLVSRMYRDLRLTSIGGGADEVMLGIICKTMGILPKPEKNKK